MTTLVHLQRNAGHPWDGRPGFDLLFLNAQTEEDMAEAVAAAQRKFWHPWVVGVNGGTGLPGGVLYKPSGAKAHWEDSTLN